MPGSARWTLEDDEHGELLVADEAVVRAGRHEHRLALAEVHPFALDLERSGALEHDVDLVVLVRLLPVGLGSDEDVDAELEAGRFVHDLVAAASCPQALERVSCVEGAHGPTLYVTSSSCGAAGWDRRPAPARPPRNSRGAARARG